MKKKSGNRFVTESLRKVIKGVLQPPSRHNFPISGPTFFSVAPFIVFGVFFISIFYISSNEFAISQTPFPIVMVTPTVSVSLTPVMKKKIPHSLIHHSDTPTRQEAHEAEEKKQESLKTKGQTKEFGLSGKVRKIQKPAMPINFKIKPGNGSAYLSWDKSLNNWDTDSKGRPLGEMAYLIYLSKDGKDFKKRIEAPLKETNITIGNLTNGTTYYFAIVTVGEGGKRSDKAVQTVVPMATDPITK